jgi:hypothetical protein
VKPGMKTKELNDVTLADEAYRYRRGLVDDLIIRLHRPNTTGEKSEPRDPKSPYPRQDAKIARLLLGMVYTTRGSWKWRSSKACGRI